MEWTKADMDLLNCQIRTEMITRGALVIRPAVAHTGVAGLYVTGWDSSAGRLRIIDSALLPGMYEDVHHIPVSTLDTFFTECKPFRNQNRFIRIADWQYPFFEGDIGTWVQRFNLDTIWEQQ